MEEEAPTAAAFASALQAEEDPAASSRRVPLLPWSLIGVGVLIAWLCCTHLPHTFLFEDRVGAFASLLVDYTMRVGDVGTFLVAIVFGRRLQPISRHRRACAALIALSAAGTIAAPLIASFMAPGAATTALLVAASLLAGIGGAILFLLWAEIYSQLGSTRCTLFAAVSCIFAGLVALVVSQMNFWAANVAIALLPLLSGCMAAVSLTRLPRPSTDAHGPRGSAAAADAKESVSYPVPWKLVALMALAGFASGFAGSILVSIDGIGAVHRILSTVLFGCILLGAFAARRGNFDVRYFAWVTLPVAVVSLLLIPLAGESAGRLISFLIKFSYVSFAIFALIVLANVCYRHDIPSLRVFASARASSEAAMFCGIVLRRSLRASGALDNTEMLWLIALIGLVATVGCVLLWHTERSVTSDWGTQGVNPASGFKVKSAREAALERIEALSSEHGLTPRESEILDLMAQGYESPAIEQELFLSHNTLKTHLRHIYAKLGVHTRAEALELLEK